MASLVVNPRKRQKALPCGRPLSVGPKAGSNPGRFAAWQRQLGDYLASKGLKYSEQRWKIAELILSMEGHIDAQGVVERLRSRHPEIGAATVYRNIKVLCDASILKESLTDFRGRVIYELSDDRHHDHIVCLDCGEIFEFRDDKIETLQSDVAAKMNFAEVRHRHVVYAKCKFKEEDPR